VAVGHEVVEQEEQGPVRPRNESVWSQFPEWWNAINILAGASDTCTWSLDWGVWKSEDVGATRGWREKGMKMVEAQWK